jgi:hypothetical protein
VHGCSLHATISGKTVSSESDELDLNARFFLHRLTAT